MSAALSGRCNVVYRAAQHVQCTVASAGAAILPRMSASSNFSKGATSCKPSRTAVASAAAHPANNTCGEALCTAAMHTSRTSRAASTASMQGAHTGLCNGVLHTAATQQGCSSSSSSAACRTAGVSQARHVSACSSVCVAAVAKHGSHIRTPSRATCTTVAQAIRTVSTMPNIIAHPGNPGDLSRHAREAGVVQAAAVLNSSSSGSDEQLAGKSAGALGSKEPPPWYQDEYEMKRRWRIQDPEEAKFWNALANDVRSTEGRKRLQALDLSWRLGLPYEVKEVFGKQPVVWKDFLRAKSKNPYAVALIKVGEFYECIGLDAVLLCEYTTYRFMGGNHKKLPRAGGPLAQLQRPMLERLLEQGLHVAVWEEAPSRIVYGKGGKDAKTRFCSKVVTPEDPNYTYGDAATNTDRTVDVITFYGVAESISGFSLFKLNRNSNVIEVHNSVSGEALWGLLKSAQASSGVVYMFRRLDGLQPVSSALAAAVKRSLTSDPNFRVRSMDGVDPLATFQLELRKALKLEADLPVRPAVDIRTCAGVRPLYPSTLQQLGLERTRGVPSLVDYVLPVTSSTPVRQLVAEWLIAPPPHSIADATRQAVRALMMHVDEPLPAYKATSSMSSKKVTSVLSGEEASAAFFQTLAGALDPVLHSLKPSRLPSLAAVVDASWPLLVHSMAGDPDVLTQQVVLVSVQNALDAMKKVVPGTGGGDVNQWDGWPEEEADLKEFVIKQEKFRERVLPLAMAAEWDAVEQAFDCLYVALDALKFSLKKHAEKANVTAEPNDITWHTDDINAGVWLKVNSSISSILNESPRVTIWHALEVDEDGKPIYVQAADMRLQHMRHPYDRNGAVHKKSNLWTCDYLDEPLNLYRKAVADASDTSLQLLRDLSAKLSGSSTHLAAAVHLGFVLTALADHSRAAKLAGWTVPLVGMSEQQQQQQLLDNTRSNNKGNGDSSSTSAASRGSDAGLVQFSLKGLWPYWMNGNLPVADTATVKNDVTLNGLMLLTGPNMAGKSTVLRSVAAAALCGCAGLAIPAAQGSMLPHLNAVVLRTFSGDAPAEGLSGFGVEMREMSNVLNESTAGSLVLVDELGKGTEILKGTALVSAIMKALAARGTLGIFASHLHLLLRLLKDHPGVEQYRMELTQQHTKSGDLPQLQPTKRLLPGVCTESMAFEVAREQKVPIKVLQRAVEINKAILMLGGQQVRFATNEAGSRAGLGSSSSSSNPVTLVDERAVYSTQQVVLQQTESTEEQQRHFLKAAEGSRGSSSSVSSSGAASDIDSIADQADEEIGIAQRTAAPAVAYRFGDSRRRDGNASSSSTSIDQSVSAVTDQTAMSGLVKVLLAQLALGLQLDHTAQQPAPQAGHQQQPGQANTTTVWRGAVHRLSAKQQPPPSHHCVDVVYVARLKDGLWYAGETQHIDRRFKQHARRKGAQELWYVLIDPQREDRKVRQGYLIEALMQAGVPMQSVADAHHIRRK